jgi:hypothetical protein
MYVANSALWPVPNRPGQYEKPCRVSINTKVSVDTIVQFRRIYASVVMPYGL